MDNRFKEPYSHPRWWWAGDYIPGCFYCIHFNGLVDGKPRCNAFPNGIPKEFMGTKEIKHNVPYPGDHGILFQKMEEE